MPDPSATTRPVPAPTTVVDLPDGRVLALDDLGDRAGRVVVYLHGTPDCRLARHPADGVLDGSGTRLLAVDRPGFGASSPDPVGDLGQLGRDLEVVLDHLGVGQVGVLGWSAGGLAALGAAPALGERLRRVVLVGTVPPIEAAGDPSLVAALGPARRSFVELAATLLAEGVTPPELAVEVAEHLLPDPLDRATATEHVLDAAGDVGRAELAAVPGALEQLSDALLAAVANGRAGVAHDVARQLEAGLDLGAIGVPVRTVHGDRDPVSPPPVGAWLAERLGSCTVDVVAGAGHQLLLPGWVDLVAEAAR